MKPGYALDTLQLEELPPDMQDPGESGTFDFMNNEALTPEDRLAEVEVRLSDASVTRPIGAGKPMYAPLATGEDILALLDKRGKKIHPALPDLLMIRNAGTLNWADAAKKFERDEQLCRHILGHATNCGLTAEKVTSIARAVSLLSVPKILDIGLAIGYVLWTSRFRLDRAEKLDVKRYLRHVLVTAAVAKMLVEELPGMRIHAEEAYAAVLMQKVGIMALQYRFPGLYSAILSRQRESGRPLHEVERQVIQIDHGEVAAHLLQNWKLPASIVETARGHLKDESESQPSELTCIGMMACRITTAVGLGVVKKQDLPEFGLGLRDFLRRVRPQWARGDSLAQMTMYCGERTGLRDIDARQILAYLEMSEDMRYVNDSGPQTEEESGESEEDATPEIEITELTPAVTQSKRTAKPKPPVFAPKEIDDTPFLSSRIPSSAFREPSIVDFLIPGLAQIRHGSEATGRVQLVCFSAFTMGSLSVAAVSTALTVLFVFGMVMTAIWSLLTFPNDRA